MWCSPPWCKQINRCVIVIIRRVWQLLIIIMTEMQAQPSTGNQLVFYTVYTSPLYTIYLVISSVHIISCYHCYYITTMYCDIAITSYYLVIIRFLTTWATISSLVFIAPKEHHKRSHYQLYHLILSIWHHWSTQTKAVSCYLVKNTNTMHNLLGLIVSSLIILLSKL